MKRLLRCGSLILFYAVPAFCLGEDSVETKLYNDMFSNYNPKIRPIKVSDYNAKIIVDVTFSLTQLEELNEKEEQITVVGAIVLGWTDQLLQWNSSDYNGATAIVVPAENIWLPEIAVVNSVIDVKELAFEQVESRVRIMSNGYVIWIPVLKWKSACKIDVALFPYDRQECAISFSNWMYTGTYVDFSVTEEVDLTGFQLNTGWNLTEVKSSVYQWHIGSTYLPLIDLTLKLKRNAHYFEMNVLIPAILLSFLLVPMFILPVESGEKVSLGVTLMLSYTIFLLVLTEYTPPSGTIPAISLSLIICVLFAALGIFINVVIINIHYHSPNKGVPDWVRKLILHRLGRILCGSKQSNGKTNRSNKIKVEPMLENTVGRNNKTLRVHATHQSQQDLVGYLEFLKNRKVDEDHLEQNKEDWNKVARVLDRLFLLVYLVYFVIYVITVFTYKIRYES